MTATVVYPEADQVAKPSPATDLGKILACAIISKTLVLPALWSPTTTTWKKDTTKIAMNCD